MNDWAPWGVRADWEAETTTAHGSEEWTAVNGSSTVATKFEPGSLADGRWEPYVVAAAAPVTLNFGVGMVEQPLSTPRVAAGSSAAGRPSAAGVACPRSGGRPSASRSPAATGEALSRINICRCRRRG